MNDVIRPSNELTPKQLAAVLRTLARGYHVDSGAIEALNAAALIVEKATPTHETFVQPSHTCGVCGNPQGEHSISCPHAPKASEGQS